METRDRLRALTRAAYTAAAGHLEVTPEDDPAPARWRWAPSVRAAVAAAIVIAVLGLGWAAWSFATAPADPVPLPTAGPSEPAGSGEVPAAPTDAAPSAPATRPTPAPARTDTSVVVHVAGAVARPGVVELPGGARVADAVAAAGGATDAAEPSAVNLARVLVDGEQVYLPAVGEAVPGAGAGPAAAPAAPAGPAGDPAAGRPPAAGGDGSPAGPVNLNTATAAELDTLPGVGPAIADRIIQWRDLNGPFLSVDDLDAVAGIGPATMERLRALVSV
ncbi:helix-hairpin-helix domain-containing protein [Georgenia yuyongxinii]